MELVPESIIEKLEHRDFRVLQSENSPVIFVYELLNPKNILIPSQILALEDAKLFVLMQFFLDILKTAIVPRFHKIIFTIINLSKYFFYDRPKCDTFVEILEENKLVEILESLSKKFNGGIVQLTATEKTELKRADLTMVVNFFDGR